MRIMILATLAVVSIFIWLGYDTQEAIERCKAANIQANETCEAYAR